MAITNVMPVDELGRRSAVSGMSADAISPSAVSWGAIFAGAAAAAALSLILIVLGTGLGLSSVSPWANSGMGAGAFTLSTVAWLTFTQIVASGMGGYLAGRLRTRWASVHTDEVYFRDTAHGFLSWAMASLVTAALLGSVIGSILSGGVQAGGAAVSGAAKAALTATAGGAVAGAEMSGNGASEAGPLGYFVDSLFRRDQNAAATSNSDPTASGGQASANAPAEITRIFTNSLVTGKMPQDDTRYVAQVIAQRTGLSQQDAEKRVNETFARARAKLQEVEANAREVADTARKATAYTALWLFVSLLIGAFCASFMATYGGRRRDLQP